jgi:mRNA degradation ribonuclease J1/J2
VPTGAIVVLVCIHRGSHEIGGSCVEVEYQSQRLVLDAGRPLDADLDTALPLLPVAVSTHAVAIAVAAPRRRKAVSARRSERLCSA